LVGKEKLVSENRTRDQGTGEESSESIIMKLNCQKKHTEVYTLRFWKHKDRLFKGGSSWEKARLTIGKDEKKKKLAQESELKRSCGYKNQLKRNGRRWDDLVDLKEKKRTNPEGRGEAGWSRKRGRSG